MKVAAVCIAKNEDRYIDEWVQYHWKLGIDDVFVFQNNWRYQGDLPEKYNHLGEHHMYLYPLDGEVKQLNAYNAFTTCFSQMYDWAAYIDVDEFIAVNGEGSLKDMLDQWKLVPQLSLNWRLIGDNGLHDDGTSNSVIQRFTMGAKSLNKHVKQLVNFKFIRESRMKLPVFVNPHCTNAASVTVAGDKILGPFNTSNLDEQQPLELYHYATKTREELHAKVMRGRADTTHGRQDEEESYFKEHNINEVPCLAVKSIWELAKPKRVECARTLTEVYY